MSKINRRTVLRGIAARLRGGRGVADVELLSYGQRSRARRDQVSAFRFASAPGSGAAASFRRSGCLRRPAANFAMPEDLQPLEPYRNKLAILSGFDVKLDGVPNKPHITGCLGLRTGVPVPNESVKAPTLDVIIGDEIGKSTRFRSLEISTSGTERSYSYRAAGSPNPSEVSPTALYQRIFGAGFQDPNSVDFKPDPSTMVRQSVLSAVQEDRQRLMREVGVEDRRRLDEYFTSIRQLEEQLALQLQPPAPVQNFTMPKAPPKVTFDSEMDNVLITHRLMAGLLAKALQCNQTRVFNVLLSDTASNLRRKGSTTTHHTLTHEEPTDPQLGYQKEHVVVCHQEHGGLARFPG